MWPPVHGGADLCQGTVSSSEQRLPCPGPWVLGSHHEHGVFFYWRLSKLGLLLLFKNIIWGREDRVKEHYIKKLLFSTKTFKGVGFLTLGSNSHNLLPATTFWLCPRLREPTCPPSSSRDGVPEAQWRKAFSWEDSSFQEAKNQTALRTT